MSCNSGGLPCASITSSYSLSTCPLSPEGLPFYSRIFSKLQTHVLPPLNIKSFQFLSGCGQQEGVSSILYSCISSRFLHLSQLARIYPLAQLSLGEACSNRLIRATQIRAVKASSAHSSGSNFAIRQEAPPTTSISDAVPTAASVSSRVQSTASTVTKDLPAVDATICLAPCESLPLSKSPPSDKPKLQSKVISTATTTSKHRGAPTSPSQTDLVQELKRVASLRRRGSDLDQCISKVLAQHQPKTSRAWTKALEGIGRLPQGGPDLAIRVLTWLVDKTEERVTERQWSNILAAASRSGSTEVVERVFGLMKQHQVSRTTQVSLPCGWLVGWPIM